MDITLKQVDEAVSDPAKKVEMIEKLMANIKVIEDENGAKFEIIQLKDVTVIPTAINPNAEMLKMGLRMHSCSDLKLRDEDVLVVNYLKTVTPGGFFDYYNTWQKEISENKAIDVLIVHYEDMKTDGISELRRMSKFLGLEHSDERLQQVIDRCSINNLRADVESGKVKSPLVNKEGKSILYRKGVIGDWKNHFTVAQNEAMDALIAEKLKDSIFKCQY